jgi:hypothetical protein
MLQNVTPVSLSLNHYYLHVHRFIRHTVAITHVSIIIISLYTGSRVRPVRGGAIVGHGAAA